MAIRFSGSFPVSTGLNLTITEPVFDPNNNFILTAGLDGPAETLYTVESDGNGTFMASGNSRYISISTDNGVTWNASSPVLGAGNYVIDIHYSSNGRWMMSNTASSRIYSDNDGGSWTSTESSNGYFLSNDNNNTWVAIGTSGNGSRSTVGGATNWNAISSGQSTTCQTLVYLGSNIFFAGFIGGWASRSANNGASFSNITRGLNSGSTTASLFDIKTDGAGVLVSGHGSGYAARSVDYGVNWSALPQGLSTGVNGSWKALATDGNGTWIAAQKFNTASYSLDNGQTWTAFSFSSSTEDVESIAYSNGTFVAVGGSGYAVRNVYK